MTQLGRTFEGSLEQMVMEGQSNEYALNLN